MERLLIKDSENMFYEVTNYKSTIDLNYYVKSESYMRMNNVVITTEDFNLRKEIVKDTYNKYKLYNLYEDVIKDLDTNAIV